MDTLFRLVSLQSSDDNRQSTANSPRTSTSSRSSRPHPPNSSSVTAAAFFDPSQDEECGGGDGLLNHPQAAPYYYYANMDHDDRFSASSSSSSKHHHHHPPDTATVLLSDPTRRWAPSLLLDCARAVAARDSPRVQHLMWTLNELASPYGDLVDQKLAAYFLAALFARLTSSGPRTLRTLSAAADRSACFDSTRRTALRFHDLSPWSSFGHVAANAAILDAAFLLPPHPAPRLHVIDLSTSFCCTQWPTLLEALATRSAARDTPELSITSVVPSASPAARRVMREFASRIQKFARLMAVPFRFSVVHHPDSDLSSLDLHSLLPPDPSALLAVNCLNSLHAVPPDAPRRHLLISNLRRLRPAILTLIEDHADLNFSGDFSDEHSFFRGFREGLRFFSAYFDSLEECFPKTSDERLALERAAGRAVVDLVACPPGESSERRDTAAGWSKTLRAAGFSPSGFSDDVADDLRALLKRYKEGWSMVAPPPEEAEETAGDVGGGFFLTWKEEPVVWASAWKVS